MNQINKKAFLRSKKFHSIQPHQTKHRNVSRLKKSAVVVRNTGTRKPRRHSQQRRIKSRLGVTTYQTSVQIREDLLGKPFLQQEGSSDNSHGILKSSKKRRAASSHFTTFHPSCPNDIMHASAEVDTPSTSTLPFGYGPDTFNISRPGSGICVEKHQFELFTTTNSVANSILTAKTQPFGEPVSVYGAPPATRICNQHQSHSTPVFRDLESSPEANGLLTGRKHAKFLQERTDCFSPVIQSEGYARIKVLNPMSEPRISPCSAVMMLCYKGGSGCCNTSDTDCSCSVLTAISSPSAMFQQLLEDRFLEFLPLIDAALSNFEFQELHVKGPEQDCGLLSNLQVKELELPLLWGYLNRSYITGIFEPHRYFVVLWQIQHASKYKYQIDTLFLAVSLLDRCLFNGAFSRAMLWLLGTACMCVAAKIEETHCSSIVSVIKDTCTENGHVPRFTTDQLIWMETVVMNVLNFQCITPTAATFIWQYLQGFVADREMQALSLTILCLSLTDYEILHFPASVVAASSVFLSCLVLHRALPALVVENWTRFSNGYMTPCVKRLDLLFTGASGTQRLTN